LVGLDAQGKEAQKWGLNSIRSNKIEHSTRNESLDVCYLESIGVYTFVRDQNVFQYSMFILWGYQDGQAKFEKCMVFSPSLSTRRSD
jgi:hypothetical protein